MKLNFNVRSRIKRSIAGILAALMVVSGIDMTPIAAFAEEISDVDAGYAVTETKTNLSSEDVSSSLTIEDEATVSEETADEEISEEETTEEESVPEEEVRFEAPEGKDVVLALGDVWDHNENRSINITSEGYCIGAYDSVANPYIPFKSLTITGTTSNENNSIDINSVPEGAAINFDNLIIMGNNRCILNVYTDVTINLSGIVRLEAFLTMSGNSGPSSNSICVYSGSLTFTGSADLYWKSPLNGGAAFCNLYPNTALNTKDFTGNIYLDWEKGPSSIISGSGNVNLETAGTITIKGGSGSSAIIGGNFTLKGSEIYLSKEGGGQAASVTNTTLISDKDIVLETAYLSAPFISSAHLKMIAGGDIKMNLNTESQFMSSLITSAIDAEIRAGGSIIISPQTMTYGKGQGTYRNSKTEAYKEGLKNFVSTGFFINVSGNLVIEAGKDFIYKRNAQFLNGTDLVISVGGKAEISGYYPKETPSGENIGNMLYGRSLKMDVGGDLSVTGDWSIVFNLQKAGSVHTGGDIKIENINPSVSVFSGVGIKVEADKSVNISGTFRGYLSNGNDIGISAKKDVIITSDFVGNSSLFSNGTVNIKAGNDIKIHDKVGNIYSGTEMNLDAGNSIEVTRTDKSGYAHLPFTGSNFTFKAGKDINIVIPSLLTTISSLNLELNAKNNIHVENTYKNGQGLIGSMNAVIKGAQNVLLKGNCSRRSICEGKLTVDIPGSFEAVATGVTEETSSSNTELYLENAKDFTLKVNKPTGNFLDLYKVNVSGDFTVENAGGVVASVPNDMTAKAKNFKLVGCSDKRELVMGSALTVEADSVVITNKGKNVPVIGVVNVVTKKAEISFDVSDGEGTKTGFTSDKVKKATMVNLIRAKIMASIKDDSDTVESIDDVDVDVIYGGQIISPECYSLSLAKSKPELETYDLVKVSAVYFNELREIYTLSETRVLIDTKKKKVATVTVGGEEKAFSTLDRAVSYASSVSNENKVAVVTVEEDSRFEVIAGIDGNVIFDLNGHDVSGTDDAYYLFRVSEGHKLTVTDSSEEKTGKMEHECINAVIMNSGTLVVEAGTIINPRGRYAVTNLGYTKVTGGVIYGLESVLSSDLEFLGGTIKVATGQEKSLHISDELVESYRNSEYGLKDSSGNWVAVSNSITVDVTTADGRINIETLDDAFGNLPYEYYFEGMAPEYTDVLGNDEEALEGVTYTASCVQTEDTDKYGNTIYYIGFEGTEGYYGTVKRYFAEVKSFNYEFPETEMHVKNSITSTKDIELPELWSWKEEYQLENVGDESTNEAIAQFAFVVDGDIFDYFTDKTITIYRSACDHTSGEPEYLNDKPLCIPGNKLIYKCTKCGEVLKEEAIPAEPHNYEVTFNWSDCTSSTNLVHVHYECVNGCNTYGNADITLIETASKGLTKTVDASGITWNAYYVVGGKTFTDSRSTYVSGYSVVIPSTEYEYTGSAIKPVPEVYYENVKLVAGKDYTLSYTNNVKANRSQDGEVLYQGYNSKTKKYYELVPSVTVKGKGNYTGSISVGFNIVQTSLTVNENISIQLSGMGKDGNYFNAPAKGKSLAPIKAVMLGNVKLSASDYSYMVVNRDEFIENEADETLCTPVSLKDIKVGKYLIILTGKNNTCDKCALDFEVGTLKYFLKNAAVSFDKNYKVKTIKIGKKTFATSNFEIRYPIGAEATAVGTHEVTITPIVSKLGNDFADESVTVSYTIAPTAINAKWFAVSSAKPVYDGTSKQNAVTLTTKAPAGMLEGRDYKLTYSNNTNAGTATVLVTGIGNYKGSVKLTYKIVAASLAEDTSVTCDETAPVSKAGAKATNIVVKKGMTTLVNGTDYTVSYKNNTKLGTAKLIITGKGNYAGKLEKAFSVVKSSLVNTGMVVTVADMQYKKDGAYKAAVTVTDNGKKLKANTDFTVTYEAKALKVMAEDVVENGYIILEATVTGKGLYEAYDSEQNPVTVKVYYRVALEKLASLKITVDASNCAYSEENEVRPVVKVQYGVRVGLKTLYYTVNSAEYTLSYANNTKVGTGKVTVTGTKKYLGSKTVTYKIAAHKISK